MVSKPSPKVHTSFHHEKLEGDEGRIEEIKVKAILPPCDGWDMGRGSEQRGLG